MTKNSAIEWTEHTWNPWRGCHKVSSGCKNCYMYREQKRYGNDPNKVVKAKSNTFNAPLKWIEPARVFTCSWSDFFIEEADEWRDKAWEIIRQTPHLTYQILTKRIENVLDRLPKDWGDGYDNVWLGVSVESQEFESRMYHLNHIPVKMRFVSAEPLLGPLYLSVYLTNMIGGNRYHGIDWVIVGGESGPGYRKMNPEWAISLAKQCGNMQAKFFMKQMGGWPNKKGEIPPELQIFEYPE